jgi:hypothetical protein
MLDGGRSVNHKRFRVLTAGYDLLKDLQLKHEVAIAAATRASKNMISSPSSSSKLLYIAFLKEDTDVNDTPLNYLNFLLDVSLVLSFHHLRCTTSFCTFL